jgi:hypothetical protein
MFSPMPEYCNIASLIASFSTIFLAFAYNKNNLLNDLLCGDAFLLPQGSVES